MAGLTNVGALFSKILWGPSLTDPAQKSQKQTKFCYIHHLSIVRFVPSVSRYNHLIVIFYSLVKKYILLFHNITETSSKSQG